MQNKFIPALKYPFLTRYYDVIIRLLMPEKSVKQEAIRLLELRKGDKLLDFGCGTGTLLEILHCGTEETDCTGYDVDPEMLDRAKTKKAGNTRWVLGTASTLPFPDAGFDRAVSTWVFHHLERKEKMKAFDELFRVMKPGGILVVADWGKPDHLLMRSLFFLVQVVDNFRTTADHVAGRLPAYMKKAGFSRVEIPGTRSTVFGTLAFYRALKPE